MFRPTKLNILGKKIPIKWKSIAGKNPLMKNTSLGISQSTAGKLIIAKDNMSKDQTRDTLIHEVLHLLDVDLKLEMEENTIHRLACGLYQVLKENKSFTKWIIK